MARRSAHQIVLTDDEREELEHRAACYTLPHKRVQRAKLVLYAADGLTNVEIAARLDTAPEVVGRWRRRFYEERLDGLDDRARCGAPRRFPPAGDRAGQGGRVRAAGQGRHATLASLVR
ncbi:MAG: helix-turn-helix domain-containing protein [Actinobacteria bacterium]|nr:helix-turn-helix domain-containing protein [Actinomycetota bacterium]